jgi:hypothetical protein
MQWRQTNIRFASQQQLAVAASTIVQQNLQHADMT